MCHTFLIIFLFFLLFFYFPSTNGGRIDSPLRLRIESVNRVQIDIRNDYEADEHNSSKVAFTALDWGDTSIPNEGICKDFMRFR